ncbi:hypothetical protein [Oceanobacillus kimchii]|uniref:hypothetical protein n=1 Tax=Oceanobacillus kimchii TaxID=746691 RepID=UPI003C726EDD
MLKHKIYLVIYLFLIIFAPPVIPINIVILIASFTLLIILINYRSKAIDMLRASSIKHFILLLAIAVVYILFVIGSNIIFFSGDYYVNYITSIYRIVILIIMQLICITYVLLFCQKYKLSLRDILVSIVSAGAIQSLIALAALLFPSFKNLLIEVMIINTGSTAFFNENSYSYAYTYRYYGFSATLLDTFGYGTGIIAIISVFLAFKYNLGYLILFPICVIAPFLNSRTGLLVILVGLILLLPVLFKRFSLLRIIKVFILTIFAIITSVILYNILTKISPNTVHWVIDGFESIFNFVRGESYDRYSTADNLFSDDFWSLPPDLFFVFGAGHTVYGIKELGFHSDVGYINLLWLGGIIGLILILIPFIYLFIKSLIGSKNNSNIYLVLFIICSFFITMIKADLIGYNSGTILVLLICFSIINNKSQEGR